MLLSDRDIRAEVDAGQNLVALQEGQGGEWVVVQLTVPQ